MDILELVITYTGSIEINAEMLIDIGSVQKEGYLLSLFQLDDPVLKQIRDEIKSLDINNLTPVEALNKLNEIKRITGI